jgi:hypothetical protein
MLNPDRVCLFQRWVQKKDMEHLYQQICMRSATNPDQYHKYCGFNKFSCDTFTIDKDEGWTQTDCGRVTSICDPTTSVFTLDKSLNFEELHKDYKCYRTLDNYNVGFMVFISDDARNVNDDGIRRTECQRTRKDRSTVYVYGRTDDLLSDIGIDSESVFNKLIAKYNPLQIFIGTSEFNDMTEFSGGYGSDFDGNSILLQINYDRYVHIGTDVYEFVTPEPITEYISSVGNNCVPYPYAESANWCYCMSDRKMTPIRQHLNRKQVGNVSFCDTDYYDMDITEIARRDSTTCKYEVSTRIKTSVVRFLEKGKFTFMKNTCRDESLPAVQGLQLNN